MVCGLVFIYCSVCGLVIIECSVCALVFIYSSVCGLVFIECSVCALVFSDDEESAYGTPKISIRLGTVILIEEHADVTLIAL